MELRWGERTWVMGIVNVTPDSFSGDGIAHAGPQRGGDRGRRTRAGARLRRRRERSCSTSAPSRRGPAQFYGEHPPVSADDEAALAVPVVAALAEAFGERARVSIDTSKGSVARLALAAGATIVNDVWAGRRDPDTVAAAAESGAHLVLMHNKEVAEYPDGVFDEVVAWLQAAVDGRRRRGRSARAADRRPGDRLRQDAGPLDRDAASARRS